MLSYGLEQHNYKPFNYCEAWSISEEQPEQIIQPYYWSLLCKNKNLFDKCQQTMLRYRKLCHYITFMEATQLLTSCKWTAFGSAKWLTLSIN